jgi:hypothetical protein
MRTLLAVTAAVLMLPSVTPAQSLGEVAARERARREKQKAAPAKVITDEELRKANGSGRVSEFSTSSTSGGTTGTAAPAGTEGKAVPGAGGTAATAANAPKEKTEDELKAEAQAAWREQMTTAQGDVARMQAEVDRLQLALNDTTASMYGSGRAATVARFEEAKKVLAEAQARVQNLQDQGRRSGYR